MSAPVIVLLVEVVEPPFVPDIEIVAVHDAVVRPPRVHVSVNVITAELNGVVLVAM